MAVRAKASRAEGESLRQLELLDEARAEPERIQPELRFASNRARRLSPGPKVLPAEPANASQMKRALPRLSVKPDEAAEMLGVSRDYFDEHIKPELRIVRRGSRTILIPVVELQRWLETSAARWT